MQQALDATESIDVDSKTKMMNFFRSALRLNFPLFFWYHNSQLTNSFADTFICFLFQGTLLTSLLLAMR
jgi:surface polysaccharide O-acyltransferase-like enzyme